MCTLNPFIRHMLQAAAAAAVTAAAAAVAAAFVFRSNCSLVCRYQRSVQLPELQSHSAEPPLTPPPLPSSFAALPMPSFDADGLSLLLPCPYLPIALSTPFPSPS